MGIRISIQRIENETMNDDGKDQIMGRFSVGDVFGFVITSLKASL
jgi:hypothetical protein